MAISRELKLTINGKTAKFDKGDVYLYQGDKNIDFNIEIIDNEHKYDKETKGNILRAMEGPFTATIKIVKPNKTRLTVENVSIVNGKLTFRITSDLIDELDEVGVHYMQIYIHAGNADKHIPPVNFEVIEPLFVEDGPSFNNDAKVGIDHVGMCAVAKDEVRYGLRANGDYVVTNWATGDLITAAKLNKIETKLKELDTSIVNKAPSNHTHTKAQITDFSHRHDASEIDNLPTGGGGSTVVVDNLTSTSATSALSANQGKVLDGKFNALSTEAVKAEDYNGGIGVSIEPNVVSRLGEVESKLDAKANKDSVFSMSNMGQDVKEAMTGGSVAVVGINAILEGNIVNKQVTPTKTNFIDYKTDNLLYGVYHEKGKAIKSTDGIVYDSVTYQTTDFIVVEQGTEYVFSGNTNLCFFDENKIFIEGKQGGQWSSPILIPSSVKYIRWCYKIQDQATSYIVKKGGSTKVELYLNNSLYDTTKEKILKDIGANNIKDKKISVLGDSNSSLDYLTPNWLQNISTRTGAIINNFGVAGTTIAFNENRENNAGKCFANRVNELQNCDLTLIMGGTNDVNSQIPLGNWDDTTNETLYGAINIIITTLLNKFPGKPIIWCSPIQDRNSHTKKPVASFESTVLSASPTSLVNYNLLIGAIKLKCRQYSIHFINLYEESGINGFDANYVYYRNPTDTVHMSLLGHNVVSNIVTDYIEKLF